MKEHSWLFAKKRGTHRTDSRLLGIIAEFVFAAFCILAGFGGLLWLCTFYVFPEWRIHKHYEKTICTLVDCRVSPRTVLDNQPLPTEIQATSIFEDSGSEEATQTNIQPKPLTFNVKTLRSNLQDVYYLPEMQLKYMVEGVEHTNWTSSFGTNTRSAHFASEESAWDFLKRWRKAKHYFCLFNPEEPDQVVMLREWQWENFLALIIPSSLILIGFGFGIHAFTIPRTASKEKIALETAVRLTNEMESFHTNDFPYIPTVNEITDSPGVRLAYRLPMIDSPAWTLCILMFVTLGWNAGCVLFLTYIACSLLQTLSDWLLLGYFIPLLGIGVWLAIHTFIEFRNATVVGPTIAEIDRFPLRPGQSVHVFLSQGGIFPLQWLNVVLVCEEEVVFTHGTNTRREKLRVFQRLIFGDEQVDVAPDRAFEVEFPLEIPQGAMHSFVALRNQIHWRLIVQGKIGKFPMFERSFPLIVLPETEVKK